MRLSPVLFCLSLAACATTGPKPPETFVRSTAQARNTVVIDVRDGFSKPNAMRALTEVLGERYTVEVTDPRAGFAMTAWSASLVRDGVPDLRYRTRFVAQFQGDDWQKLQVRHEANWARGQEWDIGFDAAQLDSVSSAIRQKLGRRP